MVLLASSKLALSPNLESGQLHIVALPRVWPAAAPPASAKRYPINSLRRPPQPLHASLQPQGIPMMVLRPSRNQQRCACACHHLTAHARTCACRAAAAVAAASSPALSAWRAGSPPVLLLPAGDAGRRGSGSGLASCIVFGTCRASGERRPAGGAGAAGAEAPEPDCGRVTAGENASPGDRYSSDRMTASWRGESSGDISPALSRAEQRSSGVCTQVMREQGHVNNEVLQ